MKIRLRHERLRREIAHGRLSQNRWAQKIGVSSGHLSELVNGRRPYPSASTRQALLEGLGLDFDDLFEIEEEKRGEPVSSTPSVRGGASETVGTGTGRQLVWEVRLRGFGLRLERRTRRRSRPPGGDSMMQTLSQDLRFGLRMLLRSPAFSLAAILALGLGIGGTTAVFTLVNGVLLEPLPFADPDRLALVYETRPEQGIWKDTASFPSVREWRDGVDDLREMGVYRSLSYALEGARGAERVSGARVSADFFRALGVRPSHGRIFSPEDDARGAPAVALISHGFWKRRLGGDNGALNTVLNLDGEPFQIVGILPPDFIFPVDNMEQVEVWTPLASDADFAENPGMGIYHALARLGPEASFASVQSALDTVTERLQQLRPEDQNGRGANLAPLTAEITGETKPALLAILAAVGSVLLIACVNVSNLLLARGTSRQREFAVRAALGAGYWRLARQTLTEGLLLSVGGGLLGLGIAFLAVHWTVQVQPFQLPRLGMIEMDSRVLLFTLLTSLTTAMIFGTAPAIRAAHPNLRRPLAESGRSAVQSGGHGFRGALVAVEVALAIVLLVGAGLLSRSFINLLSVEPGFDPDKVLTFQISAPFVDSNLGAPRAAFYERLLQRLRALPGVDRASLSLVLPMQPRNIGLELSVEGRPRPTTTSGRTTLAYNSVSGDYFRTMGIPLIRGRFFTPDDRLDHPGAVIVNRALANRIWPHEDPLGAKIRHSASLDQKGEPKTWEVVGIVGDVRQAALSEAPEPMFFVPFQQQAWPMSYFEVKTQGDPSRLAEAVRAEVAALDPTQPVYSISTLRQLVDRSVARRRFASLAAVLFALLALSLASLGIYGVVAYAMSQRTHEVGIRMALGARAGDILRMTFRKGLKPVLAGLIVGLPGALALSRFISSWLFELGAFDVPTYLAVGLLLLGVAVLACFLPARRASRIDPLTALRPR